MDPRQRSAPCTGSCPGLLMQVTLHSAMRLPRCPNQCSELAVPGTVPSGHRCARTGSAGELGPGDPLSSPESSLRPDEQPSCLFKGSPWKGGGIKAAEELKGEGGHGGESFSASSRGAQDNAPGCSWGCLSWRGSDTNGPPGRSPSAGQRGLNGVTSRAGFPENCPGACLLGHRGCRGAA